MEAFPPLLFLCGGIHRSPAESPHKGRWRGALIFSLICTWTNGGANNRDTGDLRRHCTHYDVTIMVPGLSRILKYFKTYNYVGTRQVEYMICTLLFVDICTIIWWIYVPPVDYSSTAALYSSIMRWWTIREAVIAITLGPICSQVRLMWDISSRL